MILFRDGQPRFVLGTYEQPRTEEEWRAWSDAGINLVCCHSREELDRAHAHGILGWVPVPMILADDDDGSALAERIEELKDHPALAVWEAQDEAIWNACRLEETGRVEKRLWTRPPEVRGRVAARLDALVRGMERGTRLVRKLDPHRKLWLNESGAHQNTVARCMAYLDVISVDFYPVPSRVEKPIHHIGIDVERFRRMAVHKDVWGVEQAFAWANLREGYPLVYPTIEESRFMAWQAIAHGATGILWWGSYLENRPSPFLDGLISVIAEFKDLHPFLFGGEVIYLRTEVDGRSYPATEMGVSHLARRAGDRTMLVLINEDPFAQDVIVTGLDWIRPKDLRPIVEPSGEFATTAGGGYITPMQGYEVRIYVAE